MADARSKSLIQKRLGQLAMRHGLKGKAVTLAGDKVLVRGPKYRMAVRNSANPKQAVSEAKRRAFVEGLFDGLGASACVFGETEFRIARLKTSLADDWRAVGDDLRKSIATMSAVNSR